jgi:CRISPR-associated endonuclease/helicase Cas3
MVQRFGRVNRFGNRKDTKIHIFSPAEFKKGNDLDDQRQKTLELLNKLSGGEANPKALGELNAEDCLAAFTPTPTILPATDILFDSWSLTTIKGKLPGRPAVEPYLHGVSEYEPPETYVAWREEVGVITGELLKQYDPEELLEAYPLKPHELLRDRSVRVLEELKKLAKRHPEAPVWLMMDDGSVEPPTTLEILTKDNKKDRIDYRTIVLPPSVGGLSDKGSMDGDSGTANDVADTWPDKNGTSHRIRIWDGDAQFAKEIKGMRLILTLDTERVEDEGSEEGEVVDRRYWSWYESPKSADNDGSKNATKAVLWQVHTEDVVRSATRIVEHLPLSQELRGAIIIAARWHDLGKKRMVFQRILGNPDSNPPLAKSGRKMLPYSLGKNFRHEFASLLDARKETDFDALSQDLKELVLHLIAAHHGRARPHFPTEEAYDPEAAEDISVAIAQVPQRFARLQRKYGRWRLAYLESLLRAADYDASANPSAFWGGEL